MRSVSLSSFHRWRNQNSDELSHLSKSTKPDVECKARSSDSSQGSLRSTSDFKRCSSWPHVYLLLPISMTLFPAQGWKSRPACTEMVQLIAPLGTNPAALEGTHKSLSQTRDASHLAREQLVTTCRGMSLETTWLKGPFPRSLRGDTFLQLDCFRCPKGKKVPGNFQRSLSTMDKYNQALRAVSQIRCQKYLWNQKGDL